MGRIFARQTAPPHSAVESLARGLGGGDRILHLGSKYPSCWIKPHSRPCRPGRRAPGFCFLLPSGPARSRLLPALLLAALALVQRRAHLWGAVRAPQAGNLCPVTGLRGEGLRGGWTRLPHSPAPGGEAGGVAGSLSPPGMAGGRALLGGIPALPSLCLSLVVLLLRA